MSRIRIRFLKKRISIFGGDTQKIETDFFELPSVIHRERERNTKMDIQEFARRRLENLPDCECCVCYETKKQYPPFSNISIKCFQCGHFTCKECSEQIWDKSRYVETTTGILYNKIFTCPMCRTQFNEMEHVDN